MVNVAITSTIDSTTTRPNEACAQLFPDLIEQFPNLIGHGTEGFQRIELVEYCRETYRQTLSTGGSDIIQTCSDCARCLIDYPIDEIIADAPVGFMFSDAPVGFMFSDDDGEYKLGIGFMRIQSVGVCDGSCDPPVIERNTDPETVGDHACTDWPEDTSFDTIWNFARVSAIIAVVTAFMAAIGSLVPNLKWWKTAILQLLPMTFILLSLVVLRSDICTDAERIVSSTRGGYTFEAQASGTCQLGSGAKYALAAVGLWYIPLLAALMSTYVTMRRMRTTVVIVHENHSSTKQSEQPEKHEDATSAMEDKHDIDVESH